jgi:hypothetical protein
MSTKTSFFGLALGVLALIAAPKAEATMAGAPDTVGACTIQADLRIDSLHIVIGGSRGFGYGNIVCNNVNGTQDVIPVIVRTQGYGVGIGGSSVRAAMLSAGIGVVNSGYDLLGRYAMAKGSAHFFAIGADIGLSITADGNGFSIPLNFQVKAGPGLEVSVDLFGSMTVELDRARRPYRRW